MSTENLSWGFTSDNDSSLEAKQGGVFGLNTNARFDKFEFNPNGGKDNTPLDVIDINIKVEDKIFMTRIFDIQKLWKNGNEVLPSDPDYIELYKKEQIQKQATLIHYLKALGVTEEAIKTALQNNTVKDFKTYALVMTSLVPSNFKDIPVDVFLQWQYSISTGRDRTYLELPRNMKSGKFITGSIKPVGKWEAQDKDGGLIYTDNANNEHPIHKSSAFMESPSAKQQIEGQMGDSFNPMLGNSNEPQETSWG